MEVQVRRRPMKLVEMVMIERILKIRIEKEHTTHVHPRRKRMVTNEHGVLSRGDVEKQVDPIDNTKTLNDIVGPLLGVLA